MENGLRSPLPYAQRLSDVLGIPLVAIQYPDLSAASLRLAKAYDELDDYGQRAVDAVCDVETRRNKEAEAVPIWEIPIKPRKRRRVKQRLIPFYYSPPAAGASAPSITDEYELVKVGNNAPSDADYIVRVSGGSMEPILNDGETVYVKATQELTPGAIGIFSVDGEMLCKFYDVRDGNVCLVSANPELKDTNVIAQSDEDWREIRVLGVVLGHPASLPEYWTHE
jgi:SOS-response transcriptional repressor LexA